MQQMHAQSRWRKGSHEMKIKFDIDCTPEEARQFLGLPNLALLQEKVMKEVGAKVHDQIQNLDAERLLKTMLSMTFAGWDAVQKTLLAVAAPHQGENTPKQKSPKQ